jgi:hypothetical protein
MYIVKTKVPDLFEKATFDPVTKRASHEMMKLQMPDEFKDNMTIQNMTRKHYPIQISPNRFITTFCHLRFPKSFSRCKKPTAHDEKLKKLFRNGETRLKKELDIDTIIKNTRASQVYLKDVGLDTARMKYVMQHHEKNVVLIDTSDEEVGYFMRKFKA